MTNEYEIRGDVTVIFLHVSGEITCETAINTVDLHRANEFNGEWYAKWSEDSQCYYVYGSTEINGKRTMISLHRWLMNAPKNIEVDHVNNNGLDNCRSYNLRFASGSENKQNRRGAQKNSKTGIRGVSLHKPTGKWIVQVAVNGKHYYCGLYEDLKHAENKAIETRKLLMPYSKENLEQHIPQIQINIPKHQKHKSKSGIKGVYYHIGKWRVRPRINGKMVEVGVFESLEDAQKALENKLVEAN
jgi:hypothetical protein